MKRFRRWLHYRGIHRLCRTRWTPREEYLLGEDGSLVDITSFSSFRVQHY